MEWNVSIVSKKKTSKAVVKKMPIKNQAKKSSTAKNKIAPKAAPKTAKIDTKTSLFASAFLANIPDGIKKQFDVNILTHVVARHEKLSMPRKQGETTIEVFNPTQSQYGWNGRHTALNIISDDKA